MRKTTIVIGLVIILATGFSTAGETPGPEAFLPTVGEKDCYTPTASFGKDVFLVVWRSGHLAPGDLRQQGLKFDAQMVGCRLDKSGKPLDVKPFVVSAAADLRERPRLAFGHSAGSGQGSDVFLAVWQDLRNGKDYDVYAARITPEGKVLDPDGIPVGCGALNQAMPDVVWDGKAFQVVWMDFRSGNGYEIYGARVSTEGKVLDAVPAQLATGKLAGEQHRNPCVAVSPSSGGRIFLYWHGGNMGYNCRLAACQFLADGKASGEPTFTETDPLKPPGGKHPTFPASLAAGPQEYLLTWTTQQAGGRGGPPGQFNAAVFDPEGKLRKMVQMSPAFLPNGQPGTPWGIRNPQAAWDGKGFLAAWDQQDPGIVGGGSRPLETIHAARVGPAGECSPAFRVAGEGKNREGEGNSPAIKPCVASDGAGTALIAYEKHPATGDVPIKIGFRMLSGGRKGRDEQ